MGGGMMAGGMMDGSGQQMGPAGPDRGYYDQDHVQRQEEAWQHAREAYDRDMRRMDYEIRQKEQALNAETQKNKPDEARIENLRHELRDLEKRYDDRRAQFESQWNRNY